MAVFAVGFLIGGFSSNDTTYIENKKSPSIQTTNKSATETSTPPSTTKEDTSGIISNMTDDQKKFLGALGIDTDKITPTMIACAEASLGASRVEEIKKGASLSFTEKAKLLACYK